MEATAAVEVCADLAQADLSRIIGRVSATHVVGRGGEDRARTGHRTATLALLPATAVLPLTFSIVLEPTEIKPSYTFVATDLDGHRLRVCATDTSGLTRKIRKQ